MAARWVQEGARWLHLVDLDGAFSKGPKNREAVADIAKSLTIPVQVGGGIRTLATIQEYLDMGVGRVILGTVALRDPDLVAAAVDSTRAASRWDRCPRRMVAVRRWAGSHRHGYPVPG